MSLTTVIIDIMRGGKEMVEMVGCDHVDEHHRCCHDAVHIQHVVRRGQVERKAEHLPQVCVTVCDSLAWNMFSVLVGKHDFDYCYR
jgi:hypothetical protein